MLFCFVQWRKCLLKEIWKNKVFHLWLSFALSSSINFNLVYIYSLWFKSGLWLCQSNTNMVWCKLLYCHIVYLNFLMKDEPLSEHQVPFCLCFSMNVASSIFLLSFTAKGNCLNFFQQFLQARFMKKEWFSSNMFFHVNCGSLTPEQPWALNLWHVLDKPTSQHLACW